IVAKNPEAGKALDALFLSREVHKTYDAVVYNAGGRYFPGAQADIDIPLGFSGLVLPRITMGVGDLEAHTHLECSEIHGNLAWLRVQIHSGRQHQIRVHLALEGTPIIGDKLYLFGEAFYKSYLDNEETPMFAPHRHLLHAGRLSFSYRGKDYSYVAPAPDVMQVVFKNEISPAMFPTDYSRLFLK
ncbi:MAG: RNA pseudouridine synthase, partial [Proteobacteria bacterium]|nr:RNA pseudouridine synthase [Pseudomonadota bacterium]